MSIYFVRVLKDMNNHYEGLGDIETWVYSKKEDASEKLKEEYQSWKEKFIKDAIEESDISFYFNGNSFSVHDDNNYISGDMAETILN